MGYYFTDHRSNHQCNPYHIIIFLLDLDERHAKIPTLGSWGQRLDSSLIPDVVEPLQKLYYMPLGRLIELVNCLRFAPNTQSLPGLRRYSTTGIGCRSFVQAPDGSG